MALSANTVWELNASATANSVNGGGFNPSNANMLTDLTTDSNTANTNSPVCSSASYNFVAGDVGNWLYIKSGTNWTPGWYQIASVASNKATLTATIGTAIQADSTIGLPSPKYSTNTVAGCATVGTPTNGTFAIDYSQATAAIINAVADFTAVGGSTTLTSATAGFTPVMVGNIFHQTTTGTGAHGIVGWYEIVSYTNATTVVTDRTTNDGTASVACTGYVGGAISLNSTIDDSFFETGIGTNGTGGMRYFVKNGTFTLGQAVSIAATGGTRAPIVVEGYNSTRGDTPTGSNRPTIDATTVGFVSAANWNYFNLIWTGSSASMFTSGTGDVIYNCKGVNTSTTAARGTFLLNGAATHMENCEGISYRGLAVSSSSLFLNIGGCYFHDSDKGLQYAASGNGSLIVVDTIIADNVTQAVNFSAALTGAAQLNNLTLYGAENKLGTGVNIITGLTNLRIFNTIIYGFTSGVVHADTQTIGVDNFNDYFNNTTDVTKWQKGGGTIALNPTFTSVAQLTGINASVSGSTLTGASGTPFSTCTANVDFVYIVSGTGATAGKYLITAVNAGGANVTLSSAPGGSGTNIVWQVTTGHNFAVGTNMKAVGFPGLFPGSSTTGYIDIGGAQRQEAGSGGTVTYGI